MLYRTKVVVVVDRISKVLASVALFAPFAIAADPASPTEPRIPEVAPAAVQEVFRELAPDLQTLANSREKMTDLVTKLKERFPEDKRPEAIRMLIAIGEGSQMGPRDGWFGPAEQAYDWKWLAHWHAVDGKDAERIARDRFQGAPNVFSRLDRNKDDELTADDLNWSDDHPFMEDAARVTRFFRRVDRGSDGSISREEWSAFFDRASEQGDALSPEQMRDALLGGPSGYMPGDAPNQERLVHGLFNSEVGSLAEGPHVGETATDFTLPTHDGKQTIQLSQLYADRPVVLVFGNFTCGPFRRNFPEVETIRSRYADRVHFVGVYVREAHPSDGWLMESNTKMGVKLPQPKNDEERTRVASQCQTTLKYQMPLLVDRIDDPVGNAYSGMPSRLYVIDRGGEVKYKSGRGPFGFKPAEMEQALVMTLLDAERRRSGPAKP